MPELEFPHPNLKPNFLAETIQSIKDTLNHMSADQIKAQVETEEWLEAIHEFDCAEHFNAQMAKIKKAPTPAQHAFAKAAKDQGLLFNARTKLYEEAERATA
jgi:hypothetical protein